mgnify:CR=1 FL=1
MNWQHAQQCIVKSCLLFFWVGSLSLVASTQAFSVVRMPSSKKAIRLYNEAARHYIKKEYQEAVQLLEQVLKKEKQCIAAYLQLATIYQQLDETTVSHQLLDQAYSYLPAGQEADLHYEIALLYYKLGLYSKAATVLQPWLAQETIKEPLSTKISTLGANLDFALEKVAHPVAFNPKKLLAPLNQFVSQYFPVLTIDQTSLIFTACQGYDVQYRENLYISHKDAQGNWLPPVSMADQINAPTSNEGTCTISADKKMLVFTSCGRDGNYGICDLYISYQKEGVWTMPQNLGPNINAVGWQSQPALSADGKQLYFVSDRKGNYGKKDIWKSTLQDNGQWSQAVNLGAPINSQSQEISPFIHPNGQTLFFASDRTPSMGGFDIYYANWIEGQWSEPVNLGYPINNHKDQVSLFITADGQKAYYADGKHQGSHYYSSYLYELDMSQNLFDVPKSDFVTIKVLDHDLKKPISAHVDVYALDADTCQQKLQVDQSDGETIIVVNQGKEYLIYVHQDGYLFESIQVDYKQQDKPIIVPQAEVLLKPIQLNQTKILQNIYFDFDAYTLAPCSTIELNRLVAFLQANPKLSIALEGHTDDAGTINYNDQLSVKRAKAIYDYLVAAGIPASKLTYQGYGLSKPLVPNNSSANKQLNRRVAFRITHIKGKELQNTP